LALASLATFSMNASTPALLRNILDPAANEKTGRHGLAAFAPFDSEP